MHLQRLIAPLRARSLRKRAQIAMARGSLDFPTVRFSEWRGPGVYTLDRTQDRSQQATTRTYRWLTLVSPAAYNDRPALVNEALGFNVPVFQIAQPIPLPPYNWTTGVGGPAPENVSLASAPRGRDRTQNPGRADR